MDIKKLNEEIEKFLEVSINEISYETKKSYLAKRRYQLDKAQRAFDRANRLIKGTELLKNNNIEGNESILKTILNKVRDTGITWNNKSFGYVEAFKNSAYIQTGEVEYGAKNCSVNLSFKDGYLVLRITSSGPWKVTEDKFNMSELSESVLINKTTSYILNILKEYNKDISKANKLEPKIQKVIEQIKNILSKAKKDKLNNKYEQKILWLLDSNNRREKMPAVVSVTTTIPNPKGHKDDFQVKAVALNKSNLKLALFAYQDNRGWDVFYLPDVALSFNSQDLYTSLINILNQLKGNIKGSSNLKAQQKKLAENKALAQKVAIELRTDIKLKGGYGCKVENAQENGNTIAILTTDFGRWGTNDDWKEDNDNMRPTKETYKLVDEICKKFADAYKTLKFSYGVSEKRMLTFYIDYTI